MILLDTNVISELMRLSPNETVVNNVNQVVADYCFISAITHAEIMQGVALLDNGQRKQKLEKVAEEILDVFIDRTLPFEKLSSPFYAHVIQQRTRQGRPIDFPDAQIASIALQNDLQLYTRNVKDFELIDQLDLINPWIDI